MSELPTTITVNVGTPAADVVYTKHESPEGFVRYIAPSPQDDLFGRPTADIVFKTTKSGLAHASMVFKTPLYDSVNERYTGHVQVSMPLIRPETAQVQVSKDILETACKFVPQIYDNLAANLP